MAAKYANAHSSEISLMKLLSLFFCEKLIIYFLNYCSIFIYKASILLIIVFKTL